MCQTCVNKYKYLTASGQLVSSPPSSSSTPLISSSMSSSNASSSSSPSPTELSSSVSSTSSLTNNDHHHHHPHHYLQTSHQQYAQHHLISPNATGKRKTISVDTLAENLAQKRLKQLQQTSKFHPPPPPTSSSLLAAADGGSKFNIKNLLHGGDKQHKSAAARKSANESPSSIQTQPSLGT